ncbi:mannosyltransferase [Sphingobacteriales bacterium UPWRP_1]|nr:hypothetical protein BVG80_11350 [Sphingobacteriales bacterium TSM_CSM]PSJ76375.1 mannosyltransferase [Sphingobacteriales bacterium UPWRP_1]
MKELHIVSFDVPYPPDYGGVIDVYHKIKALYKQEVQIYLHCFDYGRNKPQELNAYCRRVFYYKRKKWWQSLPIALPHIVSSRQNNGLLQNLLANRAPVLFEGLHTCFYLPHPALQDRVKIVRSHNIESHYYQYLAAQEHNLLKKLYFRREAQLLSRYEPVLQQAQQVAAISAADALYFKTRYGIAAKHIPAFHGNTQVSALTGMGNFALYHGNLSVNENIQAALFLVNNVFNQLPLRLIIAGKNPARMLQKAVAAQSNCLLYPNPTAAQMQMLVQQAQMHVMPTFQPTGIKLKLLQALYGGRFCVVNPFMVQGTGLETLCHIAQTPQEFIQVITALWRQPFTDHHLQLRRSILGPLYSDAQNAATLIANVFEPRL